jgi:hypothetical protein
MSNKKTMSTTVLDLEWARIYAGTIQEELILISKNIATHQMSPQLKEGAVLLRAQMKFAAKHVGELREISGRIEDNSKNTKKRALLTALPKT